MRQLDGFYMTYPAQEYRGSRFTHEYDLTLLKSCGVQIFYFSMDGKGWARILRITMPSARYRAPGGLTPEQVYNEDVARVLS